jgi:hypothetical protein
MRENPRVNWEAPFTYLLFGNHGALLIDTWPTPEANYCGRYRRGKCTVYSILCKRRNSDGHNRIRVYRR